MINKKEAAYEISISVLAFIAVAISIMDLAKGLSPVLSFLDNAILIIFILDYIIRLAFADNKKIFIKNNIWDLIAIIPFNSAFRIFRVVKLAKLARLTKLSKLMKLTKLFSYTLRFSDRIKIFFNTNGFKYTVIITAFVVCLGAVGISQIENMPLDDSFWWAFVTATTVGYGDISPSTDFGRLIAGTLMLAGIGLIGSLTSTITSYFFSKSDKITSKEKMIREIQQQINYIDDLTEEDIDSICNVLKALKNK